MTRAKDLVSCSHEGAIEIQMDFTNPAEPTLFEACTDIGPQIEAGEALENSIVEHWKGRGVSPSGGDIRST